MQYVMAETTAQEESKSSKQIDNLLKNLDPSSFMSFNEGGTAFILWLLIFQSTVITLSSIIVLTIIFTDKKLRIQARSLCLANLGLCGALAGCFITPFNIPFILYEDHAWEYGRNFCKVWLVFDNVVTSEMPMAVFLIVYDRFLFAKSKFNYIHQETTRKCALRIGVTWVWCFCLYGPVTILWDIVQGYSDFDELDCTEEYDDNIVVRSTLTFMEMIIPTTLLCYYGIKLYAIFRKRRRIRFKKKVEVFATASSHYRKQCRTQLTFGKNLAEGIVVYVLFWGPYIVFYTLKPFLGHTNQVEFEGEAVYWFNVAGYMIHPYLFALTCPPFAKKLGFILAMSAKYTKIAWMRVKCERCNSKKRHNRVFQVPVSRSKKKHINSQVMIHSYHNQDTRFSNELHSPKVWNTRHNLEVSRQNK